LKTLASGTVAANALAGDRANAQQFTRALRRWAVSDMSRDLRVTARQTGVQRGELRAGRQRGLTS
jgi:hypothetical protein